MVTQVLLPRFPSDRSSPPSTPILITGRRQSGKTTTAQSLMKREYKDTVNFWKVYLGPGLDASPWLSLDLGPDYKVSHSTAGRPLITFERPLGPSETTQKGVIYDEEIPNPSVLQRCRVPLIVIAQHIRYHSINLFDHVFLQSAYHRTICDLIKHFDCPKLESTLGLTQLVRPSVDSSVGAQEDYERLVENRRERLPDLVASLVTQVTSRDFRSVVWSSGCGDTLSCYLPSGSPTTCPTCNQRIPDQ